MGSSFDDGKLFLFHRSVIALGRIQLTAIKGDKEVVLNDDAAKLVVTRIRKHIERLGEIREMKQDLTGHEQASLFTD